MKTTPRLKARLAGGLYIISAVPAGFSVTTFLKLVVRGNPALTAVNVLAAEGAFRLGLVAEIVGVLFFVASVLFLYELLEPASRTLARFMVSFGLIGAGIQSLDSIADIAALLLLEGGGGLAALPTDQAQALALVCLRLHMLIYDLALVFFGVFGISIGALILRSTFLPRLLGPLMVIDGLGYLTASIATFLSPPFAAHLSPFVPFVTAGLGEVPLMLWLVVKAVNTQRWQEQAAASGESLAGAA